MQAGQELEFKYSGLMQSATVKFTCTENETKTISCDARVKLPVLKKHYLLCTDYEKGTMNWVSHIPVHEPGTGTKRISPSPELENVMDPVSFFMALHETNWEAPTVNVLLGSRITTLEVIPIAGGYIVKRKEKDQQLIVRKDAKGLSAIEIPVPVLGTLSLKRV